MSSKNQESISANMERVEKSRKDRGTIMRKVLKDNNNSRAKQALDLDEHNSGTKELEFIVEKDGKTIDYSDVTLPSEMDYDAFRSASFLRRSNEIKELLKNKQEDTFGIVVNQYEIRYCDIDEYDPVFDSIKIKKKSYKNLTKKDEFLKAHSTESCSAQCAVSDIVQKDYDSLGYQCYDDYLDYRGYGSRPAKKARPFNIYKEIVCGVDGCIFRCTSQEELKSHQKLHSSPLPFPCLEKGCLHSCSSRFDLKHHMLQHCKHLFPCLVRGCGSVQTSESASTLHFIHHCQGSLKAQRRKFCHLCRKLVFSHYSHLQLHPEICPQCPYPGCSYVIRSRKRYLNHRYYHKLNDELAKSMQQG